MFDHLRLLTGEKAVKLFLNDDANDIAREKEAQQHKVNLEQHKTSVFRLISKSMLSGLRF